MDQEQKNPHTFELVIRILGNEILGVKLSVSSFTNKWVIASVISVIILSGGLFIFGSEIGTSLKALKFF